MADKPQEQQRARDWERATKQKRASLDWEAIERDWRTGEFTLRELADKHNTDAATISRRQKRDRSTDASRWQKDLTGIVRQATSAQLINALVNEKIKEGQQQVNDVVLAAAQANSAVILRHRTDIAQLRGIAVGMAGELSVIAEAREEIARLNDILLSGASPAEIEGAKRALDDLLKLHNRIGSVQKLADTHTKLQALERKAFGLDDEGSKDDAANKKTLTDLEMAARLAGIFDRARQRKESEG
jgi:flagellar hook-basal body complex protein FliE